jgi:hypothetical protein
LFNLKKFAEEAVAQVTPSFIDHGKTAATVRAARPAPPPPAKIPSPNFKPAPSIGQRLTHNPLTNFVGKDLVKPITNIGEKSLNTLGAGAVGVGGGINTAIQSVAGTDQSYQHALDQTQRSVDNLLSHGIGNKGAYLTPQQATSSGDGFSGLKQNFLKPVAQGVTDIAPLVAPVGAIGQEGKLLYKAGTQGLANAAIGSGTDASQQLLDSGHINVAQNLKAAGLGGAVGAAFPVAGAGARVVAEGVTTKLVPHVNNSMAVRTEAGAVGKDVGGLKDRFGHTFSDQQVPINTLKRQPEYQPRTTASGAGTQASVYKQGYNESYADQPILVWKKGDKHIVLGGHSRTAGLEQRAAEGLPNPEKINARVYEGLKPEQARQISRSANQGAQYENTLDMAKSIAESHSESSTSAVQKQNMIKGFRNRDYGYLWHTVKTDKHLQDKITAGAIPHDEVLAAARRGRMKNLTPEQTSAVIRGLDRNGTFSRQNALNVINLLAGKKMAKATRENQAGLFGEIERAVNATDLLKEYKKTSAELVKKRNALNIASKEVGKNSAAYGELNAKITEYESKLQNLGGQINDVVAKPKHTTKLVPKATTTPKLQDKPDLYFNMDKKHEMANVKDMVSGKTPGQNAKAATNAEKLMTQASKGGTQKRDPILVHKAEDGKYHVLDGNATTTTAQKHGFKQLPVHVVDSKIKPEAKHVEAVKAHIKNAEKDNQELQDLIKNVASEHGANAIEGPVKKIHRTLKKTMDDYKGDHNRMKDIIRGTIETPDNTPANIKKIVDNIEAKHGKAFEIKNVEHTPNHDGYTDTKVIIETKNGVKARL